jgi:protein tyrosine phosphatase
MEELLKRYRELSKGTNGGFSQEYLIARSVAESNASYPDRFTKTNTIISARNRYGNVLTLDDTRVRLCSVKPGESDYINASFVKHLDGPPTIVAQAPLKETAEHFWQMCFEQDIPIIVMLTNFDEPYGVVGEMREKSYRYFALSESETVVFGLFSVHCVSCSTFTRGWTERKLRLVYQPTQDTKSIVHVHCTEWPDFGRLQESQLEGLQRSLTLVESVRTFERGPAVVHCSAGIGRSGTFVALENLLVQAKANNWEEVDPLKVVTSLRNQRPGMVQTASQYEMIYDVLIMLLNRGK